MAPRTHTTKQFEHDRDQIATLTYERDAAVSCLAKITKMRRAKNMREKAKECLKNL